jgi:hypothetical protein
MQLLSYLSDIKDVELSNSITKTTEQLWSNITKWFDYKSHINGLLLGHVQSGKTGQMLGCVSKMADEGFNLFILLTTDNVYLQQQTQDRVKLSLQNFCVIGEYDDIDFFSCRLSKPTIIVLKKNTNILRKWRNNISTSHYCDGRPIVIFDDEADAASLNTLVNKKRVSTINKHLDSIKQLSSSSIYIQITATPQAILLQSYISGWKPKFITTFDPGKSYLGGDFFYSEPISFCIRQTEEDELSDIRVDDFFIPLGLRNSLMSFLVVCGNCIAVNENTANFLIHPSVKIADHNKFADRICEHLNLLLAITDESAFEELLKEAWYDLQKTKPDIKDFDEIKSNVISLLEDETINVIVLNSKSPHLVDYNHGFNIVIGGNSLGRGITLPKLQTIYYCRTAKSPQADTYWQHSRMFGYDRIPGLLRIYIPQSLHNLFCELNASNNLLFNQINNHGVDGVQLIFPENIKPTRSNVLDKTYLNIISGGVNFFPRNPIDKFTDKIDFLLEDFSSENKFEIVDYDFILQLLNYVGSSDVEDWDNIKFIKCVKALAYQRPKKTCYLIIRRDRDITKGTGTLLSPNDRQIGESLKNDLILTLYRVNGKVDKNWNGNPLWIPNIKFPVNSCYYDTIESESI